MDNCIMSHSRTHMSQIQKHIRTDSQIVHISMAALIGGRLDRSQHAAKPGDAEGLMAGPMPGLMPSGHGVMVACRTRACAWFRDSGQNGQVGRREPSGATHAYMPHPVNPAVLFGAAGMLGGKSATSQGMGHQLEGKPAEMPGFKTLTTAELGYFDH